MFSFFVIVIVFSPESVIRRFEQRQYAVDSKGVAEYIRALVATNAIAEYLPDEQSGKPSGLPALVSRLFVLFTSILILRILYVVFNDLCFIIYFQLEELKQRASGNLDESLLNPGISERQPLHVLMVESSFKFCFRPF